MARTVLFAAAAALAAVPPTAASPLSGAARRAAAAKSAAGPGWSMPRHSFVKTMTYDDTLGDWLSSASTMALWDRVQLLPPVPDRFGVLWSKKAIATRDFEVTFSLSASASAREGPKDAALAFWLSTEDFAAAYQEQTIVTTAKGWHEGLKAVGLTFLSNRPNFTGLAMIFTGQDAKGAPRQSITGLWNQGTRSIGPSDVVEGPGAQTEFLDWATAGTQVQVRVAPDGSVSGSAMALDVKKHVADTVWTWMADGLTSAGQVSFLADGKVKWHDQPPEGSWEVLPGNRLQIHTKSVSAKMRFEGALRAVQEEVGSNGAPPAMTFAEVSPGGVREEKAHWRQVFKLPAGTLPASATECFMGFTGYTGTATSVEANLHRLEVLNFDAARIGEQEQEVLGDSSDEWTKVLEQEKRYLSQSSQTQAVERLTKLLRDHVDSTDKVGETVREDLLKMEARLDVLQTDMSNYLSAAQAWVRETQSFNPQVVKDHLSGIRTILSKDKEVHGAKLEAVHRAAKDLKASNGGSALSDEGKAKVQSVEQQSRSVEQHAERGSMQTNGLLLVMVVAVACLGLLFLSRMRYYEKKHYI